VRITSCNPTEIKDPAVPPPFSGYPVGEKAGWEEYWAEYRRALGELQARFDSFCREHGTPPLPEREFIHESPWLNLYLYPTEIDYSRQNALGDRWHNLETSVRATDDPWQQPEGFDADGGALIYLSLGSLGSADVELMQRLIDTLAQTDHRVIVSMGPQHDELRLADNMVGQEFLPQTQILPLVDLVVTHGGNNTVTECCWAGKPMVLLPLFWDQYDNAQRIHETGFGIRLDTYGHAPDALSAAIESLLARDELLAHLAAASERLRAHPGTEFAADLIDRVAKS
jgi:MGT family glycosyltransferase